METKETQNNTANQAPAAPQAPKTPATPAGAAPVGAGAPGRFAPRGGRSFGNRPPRAGGDRRGGPGGRGPGGRRPTGDRPKPEFDSKILSIRRVTRVASGGRRFSFSVAVVVGDRKGRVGVGTGKAIDTSIAIDKATRDAKKHMVKVRTTPNMSIPHEVYAKYSSARITMQPAPGRGMIAGSAVRTVLELAGMKDIVAKIRSGSKNKLNIARGAIEALDMLTKKQRAPKVAQTAASTAAKAANNV